MSHRSWAQTPQGAFHISECTTSFEVRRCRNTSKTPSEALIATEGLSLSCHILISVKRHCGLMYKASDSESDDFGLKRKRGRESSQWSVRLMPPSQTSAPIRFSGQPHSFDSKLKTRNSTSQAPRSKLQSQSAKTPNSKLGKP